MERTLNIETTKKMGKKVKVCGWVQTIRSHGKILFLDLRDRSGLLQAVLREEGRGLRPEWVVELVGTIKKRPKGMANPELATGQVELAAEDLKVLSKSGVLPFEISGDTRRINEEIRLRYRYLDLRSARMKKNLVLRHKTIKFIRDFMDKEGFLEIETPLLTKSTPEGARDFLVPSRLHPGKFYALPQAPQQYKQLLMVAGIEKYFQIARCLRDEDPRADRQFEFTQLDIEMSFVEREDVINFTEKLLVALIKKVFPQKKIQKIPFPHLGYEEAMKKYKTDRPDLRKDKKDPNLLAFAWIVDFPFFEKTKEGKWTFTHNPFSAPKPEYMDDLLQKKNIKNILTSQYDVVLNGCEVGGGSIRNHRPQALEAVFKIMGLKDKEIKDKFGHMLQAFKFSPPPHGGIAPGLDRFLAIMTNEDNIREVMAFPKTGDGRCPMMAAPSEVSKVQLKELHVKVV